MPPSPIPDEMRLPLSPSPSSGGSWDSRSDPPSPPYRRPSVPTSDGTAHSHSQHSRSRSRSPASSPRSPLHHHHRRPRSSSPDPIDDSDPGSPTALTRPHHSPPMPPPVISFPPLASKSFRTAFILDRFSSACPILYASNDLLLNASAALGRPFFDFVRARDEGVVRAWIGCVKGWGVNERGAPSDGGFGFGRFGLLVGGRESVGERMPEPLGGGRARHRRASQSGAGRGVRPAKYAMAREGAREKEKEREEGGERRAGGVRAAPREREPEEGERFQVDAIFSAHSDGLMVILRRAS